MTDSRVPVRDIPILDEVGARLHLAWRGQEARRRRRLRVVAAVGAATLLAVPGAIAERSLTDLTPKQDARSPNDPRRKVPGAVLVAEGGSPAGHWRMISYTEGMRRCVGLSLPRDDAASDYAASCELHRGSSTSVGLRPTASVLLVFGILPDKAQRVDVRLPDGVVRTTIARRSEHDGALPPGGQHRVRYYLAALPPVGDSVSPAAVEARDATGRVIARLGSPPRP
jgi:hypothetical protein